MIRGSNLFRMGHVAGLRIDERVLRGSIHEKKDDLTGALDVENVGY